MISSRAIYIYIWNRIFLILHFTRSIIFYKIFCKISFSLATMEFWSQEVKRLRVNSKKYFRVNTTFASLKRKEEGKVPLFFMRRLFLSPNTSRMFLLVLTRDQTVFLFKRCNEVRISISQTASLFSLAVYVFHVRIFQEFFPASWASLHKDSLDTSQTPDLKLECETLCFARENAASFTKLCLFREY